MQIRRMLIHCACGLRTLVTLQAVEIVGVHTIIAENTLKSDAAALSCCGVIAHFIHSSPGHSGSFRALGADLPSEIVVTRAVAEPTLETRRVRRRCNTDLPQAAIYP